MKTTTLKFQLETVLAFEKLPAGTVGHQSHKLGMEQGEPLIIMMDALIYYAKSYLARFENKISEDYILGPEWLNAAKAARALLNGDGAIAMRLNRTTDSKDNGAVEAMFWQAMNLAGYTEVDL